MPATLLSQRGSRKIQRSELGLLPEPKKLGPRHRPVPHHRLLEALSHVLHEQHLHVVREELSVYGPRGERLFGVMDLRSSNGLEAWASAESAFSLGFRGATDQSLSLQIAAGGRVLVCDNLCFSGALIAIQRKHTTRLDLERELREAIERYKEQAIHFAEQNDRAKETVLTKDRAKALMFDEFSRGTLPCSKLPRVARWFFDPPAGATDLTNHPNTLYALVQAFTREARALKPARKFEATTRLGELLSEA
jgi:hypothetical protein